MTEKEGVANLPMAEKGPRQWEPTELGNYQERRNYMNFQNWYGSNNWETTPTPPQYKGSFEKWGGGNRNPIGRTLRTDPGGNAYQGSDFALKTNGGSVAKNMPLLSKFTSYVDRETDARRWAMVLYKRPLSTAVDYFVNNSDDSKNFGYR